MGLRLGGGGGGASITTSFLIILLSQLFDPSVQCADDMGHFGAVSAYRGQSVLKSSLTPVVQNKMETPKWETSLVLLQV